ncbi:MAG: hypothetical protein OEY89_13370 [Gammaproteobacteria bacterium]|nr:hypothetical protein [Gammaproteobacteria bacterium]
MALFFIVWFFLQFRMYSKQVGRIEGPIINQLLINSVIAAVPAGIAGVISTFIF